MYAVTRQTNAPLTHHTLSATHRAARDIARMFGDEGFGDLNPEYQRGSVWTVDQRINLVKSWLMGVPIPAIIIKDRISGTWPEGGPDGLPLGGFTHAVIDGKQRIETAIAWFVGDLAVPASWFPADEIEQTENTGDGAYVRYTGLTAASQRLRALRFLLPTVEAKVATIQEEAALYLLVNGAGTPQAEADMANAATIAAAAHSGAGE